MRGSRIWTLGLVLAVVIVPAAFAAATMAPSLAGTITAIHPADHTLRVESQDGHEMIYLSNATKYEDAGKEVKVDDLKVGDQVKIEYLLEGYAKTATRIEVVSQGSDSKPMKK